jgi:hypothetical protein
LAFDVRVAEGHLRIVLNTNREESVPGSQDSEKKQFEVLKRIDTHIGTTNTMMRPDAKVEKSICPLLFEKPVIQ